MKVMIAGEGPNEIGRWARDPSYAGDYAAKHGDGVIGALLERVAGDLTQVAHGCELKNVRKYRVGRHGDGEARTIAALLLDAKERGVELLVVLRDQDGDADRAKTLLALHDEPPAPGAPRLVIGVPTRALEAWILAALGERRTESMSSAALLEDLERRGVAAKKTEAYVDVVKAAPLDALPADATQLHGFLERLRAQLRPAA